MFEKNKRLNYSNQSFKTPSVSVGGKTLKNPTKKKKKYGEMQSYEEESVLLTTPILYLWKLKKSNNK